MAYFRFSRKKIGYRPRRRRNLPGRTWMRYGAKAGGLAYRAYKGFRYLRSLINVEHQKIDFNLGATGVTTTPVVTQMTAVAVGDSEGSRTGNSILCKYLYQKLTVRLNASANYSRLRYVVVRDKQQVGDTAPSWTDVYESTSTTSLLNKNTVGRFDILYDRCFDLDANNPQYLVDKYIRLNSHARYNGTASTDIQKGGIWVMYVSDELTNNPTLSYNNRLMYIDN